MPIRKTNGGVLGFKARRTAKKVSTFKMVARVLAKSAEKKQTEIFNNQALDLYGNTAANGSLVTLVSGVATGTDNVNRIGRKVSHASLEYTVMMYSGTAGPSSAFVAAVLDRQPNGAAPAFSDIFDVSTITTSFYALHNTILYQDRFKVLSIDRVSMSTLASGNPQTVVHRYVDLSKLGGRDQTANFNGTGATVGSINEGAIFLVFGSINVPGAQSGLGVLGGFGSKYRFTDV